jgi:hypothetical protein
MWPLLTNTDTVQAINNATDRIVPIDIVAKARRAVANSLGRESRISGRSHTVSAAECGQ